MYQEDLRLIAYRLSIALVFLVGLASVGHAQVPNLSGQDSTIYISRTVFVPKHPYGSGKENWGIATGDMDKDGDIDLVSASNLDGMINVAIFVHIAR